jgi:RNA polymerase sigma-70 factor (ECF subfamily)
VRRVADGDRDAFRPLVERHGPAVRRLARGIVGRDAAEDVVQQTFLAAFRGAGAFRGEASVRTWLLTIARNTAYRAGRKASARRDEVPMFELGVEAGWGSETPERLASLAERRERLERALAVLNDEDREIVILRDVEQLKGEEAAEALGIGIAAMKSRLHRARLRLAAALRREGEDDARA